MGKLAVPEYILNKPGKLTEAEFAKMKTHASVGADILSAIEFPYPVVPIVRHHHENWDGTGYPAGIKGTAIPIGARILSVVDCFDALTSDRPYRPRLPDDQALTILKSRRGTMYDPMIVDTFFKVHCMGSRDLPPHGPPSDVLDTITHSRHATGSAQLPGTFEQISTRADKMMLVYELTEAVASEVGLTNVGGLIASHLNRLIPSIVCVFFVYNRESDDLDARHTVGDELNLLHGLRINLGQRLSGWVGANRQTISNSDAVLDLGGDLAHHPSLQLRSCLSTPLIAASELVGVLALYSREQDAFTDHHQRLIEAVAEQTAHSIKSAVECDSSSPVDSAVG
jgi:putative methionine-R-sulfoxide reductase with GAF domain